MSQSPWIRAGSFKDNVTFELPEDSKRYTEVVHACSLVTDLQHLPSGDATELGERGINLSGESHTQFTYKKTWTWYLFAKILYG